MSTKYNGISPTGKIVIRGVPIGWLRSLQGLSAKRGTSKRRLGSVADESYVAIKEHLIRNKINAAAMEKSRL
jgi:hypothetical protein